MIKGCKRKCTRKNYFLKSYLYQLQLFSETRYIYFHTYWFFIEQKIIKTLFSCIKYYNYTLLKISLIEKECTLNVPISFPAMGTYKHVVRVRSARLIGTELARFYSELNENQKAVLQDALQTYSSEGFYMDSVKTLPSSRVSTGSRWQNESSS